MNQRYLLSVTALLLALPAVLGGSLYNFSLQWNDAPSTRVQSLNEQPTNVHFTFETDNPLQERRLTLNLENLSYVGSSSLSGINVPMDACSGGNPYYCVVTDQQTGPRLSIVQNTSGSQRFSLTATTTEGTVTMSATESFTIDDTPPEPLYVGPRRCEDKERTCYISENPFVIKTAFKDGTGPFKQRDITAEINGGGQTQVIRMEHESVSCNGATCTRNYTPTCQDGEELTVTLNDDPRDTSKFPPTQDDAGNIVTNLTETLVTCDTQAPKIDSLRVEGTGTNVPTVGSGATVIANVTEDNGQAPTIYVTINGTTSKQQCSKQRTTENRYRCNIQVSAPQQSPSQEKATIEVKDTAGNANSDERRIAFRQTSQENSDLFGSVSTTTLSDPINKDILTVGPQVYAKASFEPKKSSATIESIDVQQCNATSNTPEDSIQNVQVQHVKSEENTAYFAFKATNQNSTLTRQANTFTTDCEVKAVGADITTTYLAGENETVSLRVPLKEGVRLSQSLQDEIDETREDIQDYNDNLNSITKMVSLGRKVCTIGRAMEGGFLGLNSACQAGSSTPIVGPLLGKSCQSAEKPAHDSAQKSWMKQAKPVCDFLTCQTDAQTAAIKTMNQFVKSSGYIPQDSSWWKNAENLGGIHTKQAYNPYNSIVTATASLCPPAFLKHVRTWQAIDCSYLKCLTKGVNKIGFSPSQCRAQKSQAQCTFIGTSVKNAIPGVNFITQSLDRITSILNDPVAFLGTVGVSTYCNVIPEPRSYFFCEVGSNANSLQKIISKIDTAKTAFESYKTFKSFDKGLCEETMRATEMDERLYNAARERNQPDEEPVTREDLKPSDKVLVSEIDPTESVPTTDGSTTGNEPIDPSDEAPDTSTGTGAHNSQSQTSPSDPEVDSEDLVAVPAGSINEDTRTYGTIEREFTGSGYKQKLTYNGEYEKNKEGEWVDAETGTTVDEDELLAQTQASMEAYESKDVQGEIEQANTRLFKRKLNQQSGLDLSTEEARQLKNQYDGEEVATLTRRSQVLREANKKLSGTYAKKDGVESGDGTRGDGDTSAEGGETTGLSDQEVSAIAAATDRSEEEIKKLNNEKKQELVKKAQKNTKKEVEKKIPSGWDIRPGQMTTAVAGQYADTVMQARSLGVEWQSEWGTSQFGEAIQDVASVTDTFANPQKRFCGQVSDSLSKDYQGDIAVQTDSNRRTEIGAIISGVKGEFTTPSGETNTTYHVRYKASTGKENLRFDIILKGSSGTQNVTKAIAGQSPVKVPEVKDDQYKTTGKGTVRIGESYDSVCMDFYGDPNYYFRRVQLTNGDLCQEIRS